MKHKVITALFLCLLPLTSGFTQQDDHINLRVLWFDDGIESVIVEELITEFEQENPDIQVELDIVVYAEVDSILDNQFEMGIPPDIARHTSLGRYRDRYLDLRPYLDNADEWDTNFPSPFLAAQRDDPNDGGLHGYPSDITVSAPFINRTLWEQAGVAVPSDTRERVTWDEWITAATEVQTRLREQGQPNVYAVAMDRSGHRFWGPSLSRCATYLADDGTITVDTEGFRTTAQMLADWHINQHTPLNVWGALGDDYLEAERFFIDGQIAFYFSGSWQVLRLNAEIGERFEWEPIPNPQGECGATGMIGGGVISAFDTTPHPEAVGKLMSYLTSRENMARYYSFNQMLPGYLSLAADGLEYEQNSAALNLLAGELERVSDEAFALQYHPDSGVIHGAIRRGLIDMIVEELPIGEVATRIQTEIDTNLGD